MKTTIEIAERLRDDAKELANRHGVTLGTLVDARRTGCRRVRDPGRPDALDGGPRFQPLSSAEHRQSSRRWSSTRLSHPFGGNVR
jgi:hypothetical protein